MMFSRSQTSLIGVDIGHRRIKAVQVGDDGRLLHRLNIERLQFGDTLDQADATRLAGAIAGHGFQGTTLAVSPPKGSLKTGVLELPPKGSGAPIEQIAQMELARMHKLEPGRFEMAIWTLPAPARAGTMTHAMGAACDHESSTTLIDTLLEAGFEVDGIDVPAWAVARACRPRLQAEQVTLVVDVGWTSTELTVMHGNIVIFERSRAESGLCRLADHLEHSLGLSSESAAYVLEEIGVSGTITGVEGPIADETRQIAHDFADRLADEIRAASAYASHRYPETPAARVLLVGGGAGMPGLCEHLASVCSLETESLSPHLLAECDDTPVERWCDSGLMSAYGMALWSEGQS